MKLYARFVHFVVYDNKENNKYHAIITDNNKHWSDIFVAEEKANDLLKEIYKDLKQGDENVIQFTRRTGIRAKEVFKEVIDTDTFKIRAESYNELNQIFKKIRV